MHGTEFINRPPSTDKTEHHGRQCGKYGPESNIVEDIQPRIFRMKRINQFIKHLVTVHGTLKLEIRNWKFGLYTFARYGIQGFKNCLVPMLQRGNEKILNPE